MKIPMCRGLVAMMLVLALVVAGCAADPYPPATATVASPDRPWGPLAVIPPQDGADSARTEGTLRFTDTCVYLESGGARTLLIWPADRTSWDAGSRSITFRNFDDGIVTVGDGDGVVLGGGSGAEAEGGVAWVARPSADCSLVPNWGVGDVRR
jgi:hypothetical protein